MKATASHEITGLLRAWEKGEPAALDHLIPHVYRELKWLARRHKHGGECGTLQTTVERPKRTTEEAPMACRPRPDSQAAVS